MATGFCSRCSYRTGPQPTGGIAGCLMTWHVYEKHPEEWRKVCGGRPPSDPDPRRPLVRAAMIAAASLN
jgi:hypothetical protein